jgi:hypothetical protein
MEVIECGARRSLIVGLLRVVRVRLQLTDPQPLVPCVARSALNETIRTRMKGTVNGDDADHEHAVLRREHDRDSREVRQQPGRADEKREKQQRRRR